MNEIRKHPRQPFYPRFIATSDGQAFSRLASAYPRFCEISFLVERLLFRPEDLPDIKIQPGSPGWI
ncbi:MAG: hypothetical protein Q9P14_03980 [candidate division KSB1 bacterium]|nr:hypothetical protein [candidate division KSB1 bacterium]